MDCDFVLSSLRIGGMAARAEDERIAIEEGLAGQETTGPGGVAMALRTVPVALAHARVVERLAPNAWFINFTNPAGLITQALCQLTQLKVVGICDTPAELFHRIAHALGIPPSELRCDYAGLNHLGWVQRVIARGEDVTAKLLGNEAGVAPALSCRPVRPFTDSHLESHSVGVLVLLLQPAQSVSQPVERRRQPRRGVGTAEFRTVYATLF